MPSANKTPNIGLNQWEGNEYVKRQDFVDDNLVIDEKINALEQSIQDVETPEGAQTKVDAALNSAKGYTDEKATETKGIIGAIADLATTIKTNLVVAINEIFNDLKTHKEDDMTKTGGTFTGMVTAHSNTSYTVRQVRNVILSPNDAVLSSMQDGDIWIKYK